ncbi:hypothetical protein LX64_02678 [Chitinophaga skermanii]|uniref:Uncharacterized protein n=1 Tax=Chitinophaga skermanii TaxID=331697 RepID=A0A327QN98_9BACT|nr:ACT domain-containing protein [Chitinophaga skermanii]RAJ05518.1 hypothetical protein LX64_02678 [Chitinophaga skermanii]
MNGETQLSTLLKTMQPVLHEGAYVFCTVDLPTLPVDFNEILFSFKEQEGTTLVLQQAVADRLELPYGYVAAWITLTVHSSLAAVGLTAAFSSALAKHGISCNVVAGYYHDHIFVAQEDAVRAMEVLEELGR